MFFTKIIISETPIAMLALSIPKDDQINISPSYSQMKFIIKNIRLKPKSMMPSINKNLAISSTPSLIINKLDIYCFSFTIAPVREVIISNLLTLNIM